MAATFIDHLDLLIDGVKVTAGASALSGQKDIGAATSIVRGKMFVEITGYAAAPAGNKLAKLAVSSIHTDGGAAFDDAGVEHPWTVTADQLYQFGIAVDPNSRYYQAVFTNDTNQDTDADAVSVWFAWLGGTL